MICFNSENTATASRVFIQRLLSDAKKSDTTPYICVPTPDACNDALASAAYDVGVYGSDAQRGR